MSTLSTRPSPIAAWPAALLVVVSLGEVCATRHDASAVPDDAAWSEAAAAVRAGYRPGDLIVFAPEWVDPVGRLHLGDLISLDAAGRMDAARYGRIWELSIRGARAPDVADLDAVATEEHHGVWVRRYERPPVHVIGDVREHVNDAKIDGGSATLVLAEVGFLPHNCIQVVPSAGRPTRVTFPQMPLGAHLVGYVGLADIFTRRDIRAPGRLAVEIAGKQVASVEVGVDDGWVRFAADTHSGVADVTFIASADAPNRLICFAAEARE